MPVFAKSLRAAIASAAFLIPCLGGAPASAEDAAQAAARIAEQQHGGRVLKVEKKGGAYRVKLLQPSGKVKIVRIPDPGADPAEPEDSGRGKGK